MRWTVRKSALSVATILAGISTALGVVAPATASAAPQADCTTGADLDLLARAVATGEFASVITYLQYDLLVQKANERLVPTAAEHGVAVILGSPLHAGLLGSKRERWVASGRFSELHEKLARLETLLAGQPEALPRLGLRYLLSNPNVTVVLSGVATVEEIEESVAVSAGEGLSDALIRQIESLT